MRLDEYAGTEVGYVESVVFSGQMFLKSVFPGSRRIISSPCVSFWA